MRVTHMPFIYLRDLVKPTFAQGRMIIRPYKIHHTDIETQLAKLCCT